MIVPLMGQIWCQNYQAQWLGPSISEKQKRVEKDQVIVAQTYSDKFKRVYVVYACYTVLTFGFI